MGNPKSYLEWVWEKREKEKEDEEKEKDTKEWMEKLK